MSFKIGNHCIGDNNPPFIIAEMSGNHNQSLERAKKLVEAAANAGAHALKIQTYTADTITLNVGKESGNDHFYINDKASPWYGQRLYDLYNKAHTPWEWHADIFDYAHKLGMIAFSTPFDETAVDFLESLDVKLYKVASFEITHLPLIAKVARTGKPMIMSTGMATKAEIAEAVKTAQDNGAKHIVLLKCTSAYPAQPKDAHLQTMVDMRTVFGTEVGLSDHTLGIGVALAATALGASVIEKHFTLDRTEGGVDSTFSLEPHELKDLVDQSHAAWSAIGKIDYGKVAAELHSERFRQSIYFSSVVKKGEVLSVDNIRIVRPGMGLSPKFYDAILGKKIKKDVKFGQPVSLEDIENHEK